MSLTVVHRHTIGRESVGPHQMTAVAKVAANEPTGLLRQ
jgi:hypothetical protein